MLLSGSMDGCVFITDLEKMLCLSKENPQQPCENQRTNLEQSVSSVHFHPYSSNAMSVSSDNGFLFIGDLRCEFGFVSKIRPYVGRSTPLYDHVWFNENTVACGYENGAIICVDVRKDPNIVAEVKDPILLSLDSMDIAADGCLAAFGNGGMTIYDKNLHLKQTTFKPALSNSLHVSGCFCSQGQNIVITDDDGFLSVFSK